MKKKLSAQEIDAFTADIIEQESNIENDLTEQQKAEAWAEFEQEMRCMAREDSY